MTLKKLDLLKQAFQLEDATFTKINKDGLVETICKMDINTISLILEDETIYNDVSKTLFIQKLSDIFLKFKKEDNYLVAHEGKCCSKECDNKNKQGIAFIGNKSGNYINFIIEENNDKTIKDVYDCYQFCANKNMIDKTKRKFGMQIYWDEKINFQPTPNFKSLNNKLISALNELEQYNNTEISREEIINWIDKHQKLFKLFELPPLFYKHQDAFYECYSHIKKVVEFLELEGLALKALQQFKKININNELELLKWLVNHENLQYQLILLHPNIVSEEALTIGKIKLHTDFNVFFKTELLQNCIDVENIFDTYYYDKLNKYDTTPPEQHENQTPFDENYNEIFSLKYHLEKRGVFY